MSYEKNSIVINIGSYSTIVGFSNTELPSCVLPSSYMRKKSNNDEYIFDKYEMLQVASPRHHELNSEDYDVFTLVDNNGLPYNWEGIMKQWEYIFQEKLKCLTEEYPLVIVIPMISKTTQLRIIMEKYMELAFDKFNFPIIQFIIEPLATTLSMGKKNALIIDIGFNGCKITPVYDGIIIKNGITKNKFGGSFLDYVVNNFIEKKLDDDDVEMGNDSDESIKTWWNSNTWIQDFKHSMLQVCDKDLGELERYYQEQETMYLKQQEQMKQLGGTGIVTGAVPAFNSNIINMTNNPLTQDKNYLYKPSARTIKLNQKEILNLTEYLFKPQLISAKFNKDEGLSEIISKSIKKTAATLSSNNNSTKDSESGINENETATTNSNSNMIRTVGASVIIPPKINRSNKSDNIDNNNNKSKFLDDPNLNHSMNENGSNTTTRTPELIYSSLLTNVIITGSTSLILGMEQRIIQELSIRFPQYKLITFANQYMMDRSLQNWLSGVTMSNLPTWELGRWYSRGEWTVAQSSLT
ncbi:actin-related protein 7 [Monosporozyma unispora]|nr:general RNA polymerase II transcription factor [Kazachstania unispora]